MYPLAFRVSLPGEMNGSVPPEKSFICPRPWGLFRREKYQYVRPLFVFGTSIEINQNIGEHCGSSIIFFFGGIRLYF